MLGVTTILISGLLLSGAGFVEDQRERVVASELEVIGQQVASHVESADRLVNASHDDEPRVEIEQRFPEDVTDSPYQITLVEGSDPSVRITADRLDRSVEIPVTNTTTISQSEARGGKVVIAYDEERDAVVVEDA